MKITAIAFTAAVSSASARTLSGAGTTNTDTPAGGDSGSLPPAYLQVPDFKSCLASETSEDGSYEQWCMPAQMPAGCATDSWTMLFSADMEMAACSNEPTMVGTEKTITCANGENVVCNAGTYGCIDNSPTLCGNDNDEEEDTCWEPIPDSLIASMDTGDEWCAGNCVEGNEENCAAMCQPCDMIDGGDSGSLPPAYLQVPDFKSCLASETSEDGSYEQWCMPAQMPAGCATDSWTMLSSADMEMAACSNEEDEPTMVGTEKAITCANGENVVCNAGTYGCIDNSPTLCGNDNDKEEDTCWEPIPDSLIASMDTGDEWCAGNCVEGNEENCAAMCQPCDMIDGGDGGSLPPAYLQVPEFKSCLASETSEDGSYEQWCMPAQMPAGCATDSWTMLSSADMEMAACSNEEDEPTMVGTEKAITCANGENVVCNAGTYGCIDNSPTLCGNDDDARQHPEDLEAGTDGKKNADADPDTDKKEKITEPADKAPCTAEDQKAGVNCVVGMDSGATTRRRFLRH